MGRPIFSNSAVQWKWIPRSSSAVHHETGRPPTELMTPLRTVDDTSTTRTLQYSAIRQQQAGSAGTSQFFCFVKVCVHPIYYNRLRASIAEYKRRRRPDTSIIMITRRRRICDVRHAIAMFARHAFGSSSSSGTTAGERIETTIDDHANYF